jgi:Calcium binding
MVRRLSGVSVFYSCAVGDPVPGDIAEMIHEAAVDFYGDDEQLMGFYSMLEDNIKVPFTTELPGLQVTVSGVRQQPGHIVATCVCGKHRKAIDVLDLPLPSPVPEDAEWIVDYRYGRTDGE